VGTPPKISSWTFSALSEVKLRRGARWRRRRQQQQRKMDADVALKLNETFKSA